jgi:hypothetical protein
MSTHVISVQANKSIANVKLQSGGRSQNYMPPAAKSAIEQAQKAKQSSGAKP